MKNNSTLRVKQSTTKRSIVVTSLKRGIFSRIQSKFPLVAASGSNNRFIKKTKLSYIIRIPKIRDEGYLCFAEEASHIPFQMKRFYYIFDVEKNAIRGRHAHKKTEQILFCLRGKIKVVLDNGYEREEVLLDSPNEGIFLDKLMWHDMIEFNKNTVLLVVASDVYDEKDYIRNYNTFLSYVHKKRFSFQNVFTILLTVRKTIGGLR